MSKAQRTKGHNFERGVAKRFRKLFPEARRGFQTRGGTQEESDVEGTDWRIECKIGAHPPSVWKALEQARECTMLPDRPPMCVLQKDRTFPIVAMYEKDFLGVLPLDNTERYPMLRATAAHSPKRGFACPWNTLTGTGFLGQWPEENQGLRVSLLMKEGFPDVLAMRLNDFIGELLRIYGTGEVAPDSGVPGSEEAVVSEASEEGVS
jgi:hypothetical protein